MKSVIRLFICMLVILNSVVVYADQSIVFPDDIVNIVDNVSVETGVPKELILAIMYRENNQFKPNLVSSTQDYGLMQINKSNHKTFRQFGFKDIFDKKEKIHFGAMMLKFAQEGSKNSIHQTCMIYNMGSGGAKRAISNGVYSTPYSRYVINLINNKHTWKTTSGKPIFGSEVNSQSIEPKLENVEEISDLFEEIEYHEEFDTAVFFQE